jgi:hypothetical protein
MRNDADLGDRLEGALGGDADRQPGRDDPARIPVMAADGLGSIDEQVASLLVSILRQLGMAQEFGRVGRPCLACCEIAFPGKADLFQDPLRHLGGKGAILLG